MGSSSTIIRHPSNQRTRYGTLEITADSILVLSRTTRQYALFGYDEMSALLGRTTTFGDMQAVFWGESDSFNVKGIQWKHDSFREMEDGIESIYAQVRQ